MCDVANYGDDEVFLTLPGVALCSGFNDLE